MQCSCLSLHFLLFFVFYRDSVSRLITIGLMNKLGRYNDEKNWLNLSWMILPNILALSDEKNNNLFINSDNATDCFFVKYRVIFMLQVTHISGCLRTALTLNLPFVWTICDIEDLDFHDNFELWQITKLCQYCDNKCCYVLNSDWLTYFSIFYVYLSHPFSIQYLTARARWGIDISGCAWYWLVTKNSMSGLQSK